MARFDSHGMDETTYAPFKLQNALDTEWHDIRLSFNAWDWLQNRYGSDTIFNYYMNGYGVEGLVKAVLFTEGFDVESDTIEFDSEGDTCYIHFKDLDEATQAAALSAAMITDIESIKKMINIAYDQGFDD